MANPFPTTTLAATYRAPLAVPAPAARGERAPLHLLLGFIALTFIGTHPMADVSAGARADGDSLDRLAALSLFAFALTQIWRRRAAAPAAALRNFGLFAVLGFCLLSIVWSDHPELTLRRGALSSIVGVVAFAVVLAADDLRRLHTQLFAAMTGIVLLNILATLAFPGAAISELGVKGLYTQKNVAGSVAMIAAIVAATWIVGAHGRRAKRLGYLALVPILGFLLVTRSKTSLNLAAFGLCATMLVGLAERYRAPAVLGFVALGATLAAFGLCWLAAFDFDLGAATTALFSDSSFTGRDELWAFVRRDAERRLWLGHGYGAYWDVGKDADPLLRAEVGSWLASVASGLINQAHHGYLELWLHIGLPATVFAAFVVAARALRGGAAALFAPHSTQRRAFLLGMALILAATLLHNLTEATLFMRGAHLWNFATLAYFGLGAALRAPQGSGP